MTSTTLRRQGLRRGRSNLGEEQTVDVPANAIWRHFGADIMRRFDCRAGGRGQDEPQPAEWGESE